MKTMRSIIHTPGCIIDINQNQQSLSPQELCLE